MSTAPHYVQPPRPVRARARTLRAVRIGPAVPIDEQLWAEIAPLVPEVPRRRQQPGRRRRDDRAVLEGILHVLATGISWRDLPQELGCGAGVTCWRRLREWGDAGVWATIEQRLRPLVDADGTRVDWTRANAGQERPSGRSAGRPLVPDPGATFAAIRRRRGWSGPSLI